MRPKCLGSARNPVDLSPAGFRERERRWLVVKLARLYRSGNHRGN